MAEREELKRVLIMAGGTGGHVYPALAVAEHLRSRGHDVQWLGTARGIESRLVPGAGFPLHVIEVQGLRGKPGLIGKLSAPWRLLRALVQALSVLRKVDPQVVVGFGGFASGPGGLAAKLCRRPLVIHEQNAVAGTTNRILSRLTPHRLAGFEGALAGAEYCGNPVREAIAALPPPRARGVGAGSTQLLVLGGSLGAQALNLIVPQALALVPEQHRPRVLHQAGPNNFHQTREAYRKAGVKVQVVSFIDDMAAAYGAADLAICRAGALTVAELSAAGLGAILVPYPHAIDDHQTGNARWLVDRGAARILPQSDMDPQSLADELMALLREHGALLRMAEQARAAAKPAAGARVAAVCEEQAL